MRYRFLRYPGGKPKAVTFSYDDARDHDIRLAEICNRYGIKCTFNINSSYLEKVRKVRHLTPEEVQTHILDAGHEVAIHGHEHKALGLCTPIDGIRDVLDCRLALEKRFGLIIRGLAYADSGVNNLQNGVSYDTIRRYLQDLGIAYARLVADDNRFRLPTDWYAWSPTAHHTHPEVLAWADAFVALKPDTAYVSGRYPRLFYLWGHSFEFNKDQNWDLLEAICEKLSGKEDTWYATNIEIRDYVHAYDSLIFSADSSRVYNPSLITVWFRIDDDLYAVAPGQTLDL